MSVEKKTDIAKLEDEEISKFALMDALDEKLIRDDLAGVLRDEMVYEFPQGGTTIRGLTAFGATSLARLEVLGGRFSVLCDRPITEERADSFRSQVKATILGTNGQRLELWASKTQSKTIKLRDGTTRMDPNAEQIAETKAQRNALLATIPKRTIAAAIDRWIKEGKVKRPSTEELSEAERIAQAKVVSSAPSGKLQ